MKFNDLSTSAGLVQDANFWAKTDETKYPLKDKARNATEWLKKVGLWIWEASGEWSFDDSNLTTLPIATTDLEEGVGDYELPTTLLRLERVEVKDVNGDFRKLIPIDQADLQNTAIDEFRATNGLPIYYDVIGNSVNLYPKPTSTHVTLDDGLQVIVGRDVDPFLSTDTTKEPGFSEYFHRIVSIGMAMDYCVRQGFKDKVVLLKRMLYGDPTVPGDKGLKGELQQAYGSRHNRETGQSRINVARDDRI